MSLTHHQKIGQNCVGGPKFRKKLKRGTKKLAFKIGGSKVQIFQNRETKKLGFKIGGSKVQVLQNRGTKTALKPIYFIVKKNLFFCLCDLNSVKRDIV
jgi:hypothetical protein